MFHLDVMDKKVANFHLSLSTTLKVPTVFYGQWYTSFRIPYNSTLPFPLTLSPNLEYDCLDDGLQCKVENSTWKKYMNMHLKTLLELIMVHWLSTASVLHYFAVGWQRLMMVKMLQWHHSAVGWRRLMMVTVLMVTMLQWHHRQGIIHWLITSAVTFGALVSSFLRWAPRCCSLWIWLMEVAEHLITVIIALRSLGCGPDVGGLRCLYEASTVPLPSELVFSVGINSLCRNAFEFLQSLWYIIHYKSSTSLSSVSIHLSWSFIPIKLLTKTSVHVCTSVRIAST